MDIAGEQRLIQAVNGFQFGGAGGGEGDIAVDKIARRFGKQHKDNQGGQQQHRQRLQQPSQDEISHDILTSAAGHPGGRGFT